MIASLKVLEFDKIITNLLGYTQTSLGQEAVRNIKVLTNINEIENLLLETDEALKLLIRVGEAPFGGINDIRPFVKRASIGGILTASDLAKIANFIYGTYQMKLYLDKIQKENILCSYISEYINKLININTLRREIENCLDSRGQIADDATPRLKEIRTQINIMENRIKDKLNQIVSSKRDYLSDSLITIRNDRYVVPVKVEFKNVFEGIIHDTSQSGNTVFIEPKAVVDMNNKVNNLLHDEKQEIEKILRRLTESVAANADKLMTNVELLKTLDLIYAKAKYAREINAVKPKINDKGVIKIFKGRHPLINKDEVVPNDIFLGENFHTMIITGPNTGGKTVTLKTVGLFTLMMQAGLLIPANEQTELAVFENVFADIGDEQSIEQSLSTFSSHMKNIIHITNNITLNSLVLLDELGAGTDPKEGAALAISILNYLNDRGARVIATTHYSELKTYAYNSEKVINASVEFDIESLKPTYKLLIGIPGRSNALEISKRLGLNEKIVSNASSQLDTEKTDVSNLIMQLENQGLYLDKLITENEKLKEELEKEKLFYEEKKLEYENNKRQILAKAKEEANLIINKAKKEIDEIIKELKELKRTRKIDYKEHELIAIKSKLRKNLFEEKTIESSTYNKLKPGDIVKVLSLNRTGELIEMVNEDEWLVQIGILTSRINKKNLEFISNKKENKTISQVSVTKSSKTLLELDLRGLRYEEAINKLDKYIDNALLNNYNQVAIIHGHGTGVLRKAVHDYLKKSPNVKSFRLGGEGEGGVGVTIVTFT